MRLKTMKTLGPILLFVLACATSGQAATLTVTAGGDLQAALNTAQCGDRIELVAPGVFSNQFQAPVRTCATNPITVTTAGTVPERRLTPADAPILATLRSGVRGSALSVFKTAGWRFVGLRFEPNADGYETLIHVQDSDAIEFDRILFVTTIGQKRFILGNGTRITLRRSHCEGVYDPIGPNADSQCFAAYDGAGPYTIQDNFLEAASENVMFGGADCSSADKVPGTILVEDNYMMKRLAWKGTPRGVKNLFELKQAKGAIVRRNTFENNWTDAQAGYAILFTVRNDDGGCPWAVVEDVLFEDNIVRGSERGINILGYDLYRAPGSGRTQRITIRKNTIQTSGRSFQIGGEAKDITIDGNTFQTNDDFWGLLYHGAIWPTSEQLSTPRRTNFAVENFTLTNNTKPDSARLLGEQTGTEWAALTTPTVNPDQWTSHPIGHAVGTVNYNGTIVVRVPVIVTPPPPPPPNPCLTDPLVVTVSQWPSSNTGSRKLQFSTGTKRWTSFAMTWPGTLTVTDSRGCTATRVR